jgi:heme/copper-type cytochrome/quinol oxidase subunit 2
MVQIDIPAAFVVSMLSLDLGRKVLQKEAPKANAGKPAVYYRFLWRSVFFAGFVIAPAGTYLLAGWPGWEQIYWNRRFEEVMHTGWFNAMLPALFVMAIVFAAWLGHVIGYRWLMSGKEKYLRPTYIAVLIIVTIVVLCCYPSFLLMGTYDQYHNLNGQTRESMAKVWSNLYGFSVAWVGVMIYFAVAMACLILTIWKEKSRLNRQELSHH